jgi:V8-like Glu-specific endopeptidase
MKKTIQTFFIGLFLFLSTSVSAIEGMWLPILLEKINADEMHAMGMRISADEIYSMQHSSLKDAIVHFGGGCTAELVSSQGLLLTNHHCGYRSIQKHSSVDHDYLTDGFWAKSMEDELANPGLTAKIMTNMEDVTEQVLDGIPENISLHERDSLIRINIANIVQNYEPSKFNEVSIKGFYYGNQYILMTYTVFYDVRLVGAPPSNIGKFGGDTDNWMWPRHTGDFSVFRIYANAENQAADYSIDNKPYEPVQHLKISLSGVKEGDFTFVYGYPGTTQEYIPSYALELITEKVNPYRIELRRKKLDIMSQAMNGSTKVRIQYSAKYASVANGWKKWIGENKGIKRMHAIDTKKQEETAFVDWMIASGKMEESDDLKATNDNLIKQFEKAYQEFTNYEMAYYYYVESGYYQELIRYAWGLSKLEKLSTAEELDTTLIDTEAKRLANGVQAFFKDYSMEVDKQLFLASLEAYYQFPYPVSKPAIFDDLIAKKYKGDLEKYTNFVYDKSMITNPVQLQAFLGNYKASDWKKMANDPLYIYAKSIIDNMNDSIKVPYVLLRNHIDSLQQIYMKLQIEKNAGKYLYPDANSTLRVAYGRVEGYEPRDGVEYTYFTTLAGIMAKENPNIYDYVVEPKLKELYKSKDYDRYGDNDGTMHVCFIASNHTTGGNSGSPVLNADGQLIGLNFDRNWEGTMSALKYDPDQCRNITLDIRYCLFIIDKYAGAQRLISEMDLVE